jgi:hypothetical protein
MLVTLCARSAVGLLDVETLGRQQDGRRPARHHVELVDAGAMAERGDNQRGIVLADAGHQVAGDWSRRRPCGHGSARRPWSGPVVPEVKKNQQGSSYSTIHVGRMPMPAWAAILSATVASPKPGLADRQTNSTQPTDSSPQRRDRENRRGRGSPSRRKNRRDRSLVRHQPEVGRHPDGAETEGCEHREEHLVAVLGMDEQPVALADAARLQRRRQRRDMPRRSRASSRSGPAR